MPAPTVGRIVHYVSYGTPPRPDGAQTFPSTCRAAIVTEVNDVPTGPNGEYLVGLCVLNPTGMFFHSLADGGCEQYDDEHIGGSWHWPERT